MAYIEVEKGVNLYVEDWGSGKPVVFIHGWPLTYKCYEYQFTQLPKHNLRCIGIDLRGFGKSDKPWGDYNYDVFADDILKVLEALDLHDVTLVGHSMGGAISLNYLARYQQKRVAKLVLLGAAAPSFSAQGSYLAGFSKDQCNDLINMCYSDRAQLLVNFGKIFFLNENTVSPKMADWFHHLGMEASPHATAQCLKALRDTNLDEKLAKITIPTYILHGDQDKICPFAFAESLHKEIIGSQLIPYANTGHGIFYERYKKVNIDLLKIALL